MFKLKSICACSFCSKIVKDPIDLPCWDSICREHLTDRDVVKKDKIKCNECNQEYQVKGNHFESNETLKKLIESEPFLNREKQSLKNELEMSIRNLFQFYDELIQNRTKLDLDVYNHFQEMRFQIDEQREELKVKIDEIALEMIEQTKKYEVMYLKNLKENFSSFYETKSLEIELNEMEVRFRNPNLLIESIREMQQKIEESLNEIQSKLNQINQVTVDVKATNEFKPNLSSFNSRDTSLFGSIKLDSYWLDSFKSQILTDDRQCLELLNLCEFSPKDKWSLLYRGTRDGFGSSDFHSKCDGHSNTLTIFKAKESSYIFGGFTTANWDSSSRWKSDPKAFIISLTNKDNLPLKIKIGPNSHQYAIYCDTKYGPSFGKGISIKNNANTTMNNYSKLGFAFKHAQFGHYTNEAQTFLTGSIRFQLVEIEVFKKE
jgi:hypothetical protein